MINYKDKTISLNKNQILTLIKEGKITVRSGFDLQPNIILKVKRSRIYGDLKVTCIGASSRKYLTLKLIKEEQILKNIKGFTLIELMIIVAIIGIISAIIVPVLQGSSPGACTITSDSNVYHGVEKQSIKDNGNTITFKKSKKEITVSKINTDVSCTVED